MKIIRAEYLGMCFGVRDAITLALKQAEVAPLTVLGDLVHNESVLATLRAKGVTIEQHADKVSTPTVMVTAHGASERALNRTRALGLNVLEATCPLVHLAHRAVHGLVREGFHPVIIGKRDHVEVRGLTDDLKEYDVVLEEEDIANLREHPRLGVVSQTTQPIEKVHRLVELIRARFPRSDVKFQDTVCQPTKQRQSAAIELAQECELVVVVGGPKSNNTRELVRTCERFCPRVHYVQNAGDLRSEWFEGISLVGLTAGTSTPDVTIDAVEHRIRCLNSVPAEASEAISSTCDSAAPVLASARRSANGVAA